MTRKGIPHITNALSIDLSMKAICSVDSSLFLSFSLAFVTFVASISILSSSNPSLFATICMYLFFNTALISSHSRAK